MITRIRVDGEGRSLEAVRESLDNTIAYLCSEEGIFPGAHKTANIVEEVYERKKDNENTVNGYWFKGRKILALEPVYHSD